MIIDAASGILNLDTDLTVTPHLRLKDLPKGVGTFLEGSLNIPLSWDFSNMRWSAILTEFKSFLGARIKKIIFSANPYSKPVTIDTADREEDIALAYQRFLCSELGSPHRCGAEVKKYEGESILVHLEYEYPWGTVSCGWGVKEMLAHPITIEYC